ncbi:hypothetical protein V8E55_007296 [Tylopilus felleus]
MEWANSATWPWLIAPVLLTVVTMDIVRQVIRDRIESSNPKSPEPNCDIEQLAEQHGTNVILLTNKHSRKFCTGRYQCSGVHFSEASSP